MWRHWIPLALALCLSFGCKGKPPAASGSDASSHASHGAPAAAATTDARAAAARINTTPAPAPAPDGMVWVPGGTFWMGCDGCGMPDALPVHLVSVDGFWMDRTPVTNAEFQRFVAATRY